MLTYLQGTSRPDISMATHQVARFCIAHKLSHERAVCHIGRYLKAGKDKGMIVTHNGDKGLECYVDTYFLGGWDETNSGNRESVLSRSVYILIYDNYPVLFFSKLQTEISLSTTEEMQIVLSQATREILPFINLLKEINIVFPLNLKERKFHCKLFKDNNSCISLATAHKVSPRTKHIALNYHHF